ncbi:uncharacterized protein LACBIDRAFT_324274 [Laccaria bicolor S238N-H82]|uniref:Predicted protein n=1 Tax=Laccaria bicolor (strain S238N-H82 / ATCC MYA-4686) TaxID=486041 RepID=B0D1A7_LACBS|nr:uncharacterized protein LACBIDRAFT_324274 [Laccaria bicolor S238N-H82]EDR11598.1 predicted protein [Laccaria bicolor S238N-H82]|eukprot:XP_001877495.1 predicted protein [Laccaria bicolor S238N-H82]
MRNVNGRSASTAAQRRGNETTDGHDNRRARPPTNDAHHPTRPPLPTSAQTRHRTPTTRQPNEPQPHANENGRPADEDDDTTPLPAHDNDCPRAPTTRQRTPTHDNEHPRAQRKRKREDEQNGNPPPRTPIQPTTHDRRRRTPTDEDARPRTEDSACVNGNGQRRAQASPSIIPAAGPYSPNSVSLYGQGDSTYYTKERRHVDAEDSDDEFGTKLSGVTYPQPTEYRYPQVHPDLEAFPRSMTEAVSVKPTKAVTPATNPRIRKDCPVTPAPSTTVIIKRPKMETSRTRGRVCASDFDELSKSLLEESISIYRTQIGGVQPYPDCLEEHDATTAAWVEACTARGVRVEFDEDILKLVHMMTARASQVRGYLKTTARLLVEAAYGINPNARKHEIRNLIKDLQTRNNFLYKDLKERKGIYCHPAFQSIINKTWFKNKSDNGVIHPEFSEGGMLSKVTKALAITVVENCLDEWQTGEHVDVPFTAAAYKPKFTTNLKQLIMFDDKTKESDIVPRLLKHMLKMARKHAKVTDALEVAQAIQFTEDDVEAAKKEWESMTFYMELCDLTDYWGFVLSSNMAT